MTSRRHVLMAGGAVLVAALQGRAQMPSRPARIGILNFGPPPAPGSPPEPIVRYLALLDHVAGKNVVFEARYASGSREAYRTLAMDLLQRDLDVLFLPGSDIAQTVKEVSPTIPVVFAVSDDPVASGVVQSLARPGGSVTGVTHMSPELAAKRLEILKETVPNLRRVAVLYDPDQAVQYFRQLTLAADQADISLVPGKFGSVADFDAAFAACKRAGAQAMFVEPNRYTLAYGNQVAALSVKYQIPAISAYDAFVRRGGLLSFGATQDEIIGRAAAQIDKILHGTRPADIPVEQPVRFALIVNAGAAAALGIVIPKPLLLRADEVIQ